MTSPLAFRSIGSDHRPRPTITTFTRKGAGAWDLTSDARLAFHFFSLVPNQLPGRAGTHSDVPIIEWLCALSVTQIHTAALPPLGRGCGLSGRAVTRLPSHPTRRRTFTLDKAPTTIRLVAALAYQARTSTTFPLPLQLIGATARRRRVRVYLRSTGCRLVRPCSFRKHKRCCANLGLAIRRAVTDLTSDFAFPPILDSHPRYRGSCKALKARPLLTTRLRLPLRGTPNKPQ